MEMNSDKVHYLQKIILSRNELVEFCKNVRHCHNCIFYGNEYHCLINNPSSWEVRKWFLLLLLTCF